MFLGLILLISFSCIDICTVKGLKISKEIYLGFSAELLRLEKYPSFLYVSAFVLCTLVFIS